MEEWWAHQRGGGPTERRWEEGNMMCSATTDRRALSEWREDLRVLVRTGVGNLWHAIAQDKVTKRFKAVEM